MVTSEKIIYFMSRGKVTKELRRGMLEMEGTLKIPSLKWCDGAVWYTVRITG